VTVLAACRIYDRRKANNEPPPDPGHREALQDYVARRKAMLADAR
jgi:hypothetical protein